MDLLDGPYPDGPDDADMIEMDAPRGSWERQAEKWRLRWRESRQVTRAAIAGGAIAAIAGGAGIAHAVTHSVPGTAGTTAAGTTAAGTTAAGTAPGTSALTQVQWAKGPHGKPWAVVSIGTPTSTMSDVQVGTVTAVSPASLTVTSPGGHDTTYSVTAGTQVNFRGDDIGSVHKGEKVDVISTRTGKTTVALVIESFSATARSPQTPQRIVVDNPATKKPASEIIVP